MPNPPDFAARLARARFRAWHRGTREADFMIGGFFDRHHAHWDGDELAWFEALLEQDDVDIMAWALKVRPAPPEFRGPMIEDLEKLDYVTI